jgi:hypothetical protein
VPVRARPSLLLAAAARAGGRSALRGQVFRPTVALPTISVEQQGDIELAAALQRQRAQQAAERAARAQRPDALRGAARDDAEDAATLKASCALLLLLPLLLLPLLLPAGSVKSGTAPACGRRWRPGGAGRCAGCRLPGLSGAVMPPWRRARRSGPGTNSRTATRVAGATASRGLAADVAVGTLM